MKGIGNRSLFVGETLPPHLSPFVGERRVGDYIPPEEKQLTGDLDTSLPSLQEEEEDEEEEEEDEMSEEEEEDTEKEKREEVKEGRREKTDKDEEKKKQETEEYRSPFLFHFRFYLIFFT